MNKSDQTSAANRHTRPGPRWLRCSTTARGLLLAAVLALFVSACGGSGSVDANEVVGDISSLADGVDEAVDGAGDDGGDAAAATTAAPATDAPTTAAPAAAAAASDGAAADDSDNTTTWLIVGAVVVGLLLLIGIGNASRSRRETEQGRANHKTERVDDVVGGFRWVHDQGTLDVLRTTDTSQLGNVWQTTRTKMLDVESQASSVRMQLDPNSARATAVDKLARASASLRTAMDADVSLRSDPNHDPELARSSADTVLERQRELGDALADPSLR